MLLHRKGWSVRSAMCWVSNPQSPSAAAIMIADAQYFIAHCA